MSLPIPPCSAERTNSASLILANDGWERWEREHHQRELSRHIAAAAAALLQRGSGGGGGGSAAMAAAARQQRGGGGGGVSTPVAACYEIRELWYLLTVLTYQSHLITL
jgi:hypothetical protein